MLLHLMPTPLSSYFANTVIVLNIQTGGDRDARVLWNNVASSFLANSYNIAVPQYRRLVVIAAARALVKSVYVIIISPKRD